MENSIDYYTVLYSNVLYSTAVCTAHTQPPPPLLTSSSCAISIETNTTDKPTDKPTGKPTGKQTDTENEN